MLGFRMSGKTWKSLRFKMSGQTCLRFFYNLLSLSLSLFSVCVGIDKTSE